MGNKGEQTTTFRVATYNIHRCFGSDGRRRPQRIARIIDEIRADVIGLQEVESPGFSPSGSWPQMDFLGRRTDMQVVPGPTLFRRDVQYGNMLLSRLEIKESRSWDISVLGKEPRGIIDATVLVGGREVRVLVTHFGLSLGERRFQAQRLLSLVREKEDETTVLLGDINGWHPLRGALRLLRKQFGRTRTPLTFPSRFPLLPLDRIWLHRGRWDAEIQIRSHKTPWSRVASDHLPVTADVTIS